MNLNNSATGDPAKARGILEAAGYTLKGGYFWKGGKEVTVTFISPSAYTDYAEVGSLAAQELKGSLRVASDGPGCGATFRLELPITRAKDSL